MNQTAPIRPVLTGSKIRRDMFGNLRAVPRHLSATGPRESAAFKLTPEKPKHNIDALLDANLYVERIVDRLSKTIDARTVNKNRQRFSGKAR